MLAALLLAAAVRVRRESERGVVFRLGRLLGAKGPGQILLIPVIDRMVRIDLRTVPLNIPPQEIITRDNVPIASTPSPTPRHHPLLTRSSTSSAT